MTTKDETPSNRSPSRRVLAWWDVNVDIGEFHKRKLTSRPLKELERALGHRVHVESRWRHDKLPPNVWKFEAFHYLETADPALAAYITLKQLSRLSNRLGMPWRFNAAAEATSGDPNDATICAFYWSPPDQRGMPQYISSGVLLMLVEANTLKNLERRERVDRLARPVVQANAARAKLADYLIEVTAHIVCGNRRDLMEFHLPRFQASNWPQGIDDIEIDARSHAGKPNIIRVRQTLRQLREHEAVGRCLAFARSFQVRFEEVPEFRLSGERYPGREYSDGVVSFVMTRF